MTLPPVMDLLERQHETQRSAWQLRRGAAAGAEGVTFSVWAPRANAVVVHVAGGAGAGDHPLARVDGERGVWSATVPDVRAGDRYGFRIDGHEPLPDPVSRSQPDGVHALSEVVDPTQFVWQDGNWPGMSLPDFVIYEIHVGTFTPEGTFDAIVPRLGQLAALGVTAIEIMPVAEFPGRRNWGYDGVHIYAPHHAYGGPEGFRRLVNAAHQHGLGVVLDVVYNHVGPEGNYLDQYGPYFTDVYRTPCGAGRTTTRCTGSRSSTWTRCGWTRCRGSSTSARSPSSRSSPTRCTSSAGAWAARCSSWPRAISTTRG